MFYYCPGDFDKGAEAQRAWHAPGEGLRGHLSPVYLDCRSCLPVPLPKPEAGMSAMPLNSHSSACFRGALCHGRGLHWGWGTTGKWAFCELILRNEKGEPRGPSPSWKEDQDSSQRPWPGQLGEILHLCSLSCAFFHFPSPLPAP